MRLNHKEEITMSKRIASKSISIKALAIAKKQEAERLKAIEEDFLNIMRKDFEERVKTCIPWTAIGTMVYSYNPAKFYRIDFNDLKVVSEHVGFVCNENTCGEITLSIPEWVKGQKRTKAQLMLYWSNIEINRTIKSRKEQAKKACKEALEKIKKGDFVTKPKYSECYEILVTVSHLEGNQEFKDVIREFFAKKNFQFISINTEKGELCLRIIEKED